MYILVGGLDLFLFSRIYGMSSFALTNSYFSRWLKPPTSIYYVTYMCTIFLAGRMQQQDDPARIGDEKLGI
jgi:hypothetical protein